MKVKKLLCVALAVSMLGTSSAIFTASAKETTNYKLGDVNLDGKITVEDMIALNSESYTCSGETLLKVADINRDGAVDEKDVDEFVDSYIYADNNFGDVNNDWTLSVADATYIQKYLVGDTEEFSFRQFLNGDYNKDNSISVLDATAIQKQLVGLGTPSFVTDKIIATDKKYRGTYNSKTGTYKGGEYSDAINYIEETTDISFDWLLKNDVYVVKAPSGYTSHTKYDSVWVRDKDWCYKIISDSGEIWLWSYYSNNDTVVVPTSLAGYKISCVSDSFGVREEFPNYPTEQSTIDSIKTLIIPNTSRYMSLSCGCFEGLKGLQNVVLQEGIEISQFEGDTFKSCKSLKNIIWPDSLTEISTGSFWGCKSITSIQQLHLPSTVNKIRAEAFCDSGLKEITIPEHIRTIKERAFKDVPARTVTFLYKKMVNYDFEPYIFNMSGSFLSEKYTFYGYKNSSYESVKKDVMNAYEPEYGDILPSFNYLPE